MLCRAAFLCIAALDSALRTEPLSDGLRFDGKADAGVVVPLTRAIAVACYHGTGVIVDCASWAAQMLFFLFLFIGFSFRGGMLGRRLLVFRV